MTRIEIGDADTVPLEEFRLQWRFTDRHADRWSADTRRRVRPLSTRAAEALGSFAATSCRDGAEFSATFRSDDPPGAVRQRLRELPPPPDEVVLVSWDAQTAVVTDWDAFVTHWDDFCYPSSDDVTVLPLAGDWVLCYRHYEVMQFRPRRTPNAPDVGATSLQP